MAKWQKILIIIAVAFLILLSISLGLQYAINNDIINLSYLNLLDDQSWNDVNRILTIITVISVIFGIGSYICRTFAKIFGISNPDKLPATKKDFSKIEDLMKSLIDQTSPKQPTQGQTQNIEPSPETKQQAQSLLDLLQQLRDSGKDVPTSVQLSEGIAAIGLGDYQKGTETILDYLGKMDQAWKHAEIVRDKNLVLSYKSLGNAAYQQAKYQDAEKWYLKALKIRPDDPAILNELGKLCDNLAKYDDGISYTNNAITIMEKAKDTENPLYASLLNNLAGLYHSQELYDKALPLYDRALKIFEKAYGKDHPHVATACNNLALLYDNQGLYDKAKPLYKQAIEIDKKALGEDHPHYATDLNNLAELYRAQGFHDSARPLYNRALKIVKNTVGEKHPYYAKSLNNLALLYNAQGLYDKAKLLYKKALAILEKALGPEHPNVADVLENMAILYNNMGKKEKAAEYSARAKAIRDKRAE